jgi:spore coat polysaccharide biosynthesis protein SpsF
VAIVQARVASTRLPAKILLDLGGRTALEHCLGRARRIRGVDEVVVATSNTPADDVIARVASRLGYPVARGSEHDVLSRYVIAARRADADYVIRLTSDCPLLDPDVSFVVAQGFLRTQGTADALDYASNVASRRLPRGLDTEIMTRAALERADRGAEGEAEREHVTLRIYGRPAEFRVAEFLPAGSFSLGHHRWTLDTLDDYLFLSRLFEQLGDRADSATMTDVLSVVEGDPELATLNAHVRQKAV